MTSFERCEERRQRTVLDRPICLTRSVEEIIAFAERLQRRNIRAAAKAYAVAFKGDPQSDTPLQVEHPRIPRELPPDESIQQRERFDRLVAQSLPDLQRKALRQFKSTQDQEDLVARTLQKCWRSFKKCEPSKSFGGWVHGAMKWTASDMRREFAKSVEFVPWPDDPSLFIEKIAAAEPEDETDEAPIPSFEGFTRDMKRAVTLVYRDGLSAESAAEEMRLRSDAFWELLSRALNALCVAGYSRASFA